MKLGDLKHDDLIHCPYEKKDFMVLQGNFWMDEDNNWHVDCPICNAEHRTKGLNIKKKKLVNDKIRKTKRDYSDDEIPF